MSPRRRISLESRSGFRAAAKPFWSSGPTLRPAGRLFDGSRRWDGAAAHCLDPGGDEIIRYRRMERNRVRGMPEPATEPPEPAATSTTKNCTSQGCIWSSIVT